MLDQFNCQASGNVLHLSDINEFDLNELLCAVQFTNKES